MNKIMLELTINDDGTVDAQTINGLVSPEGEAAFDTTPTKQPPAPTPAPPAAAVSDDGTPFDSSHWENQKGSKYPSELEFLPCPHCGSMKWWYSMIDVKKGRNPGMKQTLKCANKNCGASGKYSHTYWDMTEPKQMYAAYKQSMGQ